MTRSRTAVRFVLVLCLAASTQGLLFVQAAFVLRQDWIAETLCVNRDRPEMDCDGACVLMERMEGHHHDHDEGRDLAVLRVALSIAPLVAGRPALAAPAPTAPRPYGLGPLLADAGGVEADVFRPPRGA